MTERPDGMMVIDKPQGPTSFDVIRRLRRITGERKLGHAGTLDPMATGLLLVMFNRATRLSQHLMGSSKRYEAEVTLGVRTDSNDAEGAVISESAWEGVTEEGIRAELAKFVGDIEQIPPQHSAIRVDGKRAYTSARKGEVVELKARVVQIESIDAIEIELPRARFAVRCGKGTYIRSLARDLGEDLGCGGHLSALRRTHCGGFNEAESITLEGVEGLSDWREALHDPFETMRSYPVLEVSESEAQVIASGGKLSRLNELGVGVYRVAVPGSASLMALIECGEGSKPKLRVFQPGWRPA